MLLAHISEDKSREQPILDHLKGTAELAGKFAAVFGCEEWGYGCGYVHDIGKYSDSFQRRLRHQGPRTDHATAGARELYLKRNIFAAYCVCGHHAGLPDGGASGDSGGEATFQGRMKKRLDDYRRFAEEIQVPAFPAPPLKMLGNGGFSRSFFIRMLFSCLVDADFLDTEGFMLAGNPGRGGYDTVDLLWERLMNHVSPWLEDTDDSTVNGRRTSILKACLKMGEESQGLYRLTVPTGGGKTISSMAFALTHAKKHQLERVIYVVPYTSIIEQNAQVFKGILGEKNVLENHYNVTYEDEEELRLCQLAAENWDRPVVVTTNVQFFESLFSNKTSKCRKLHNIAGSVIVFDEAQMLPGKYLKPCIQSISELVYNYRCTAVLCTATQPALDPLFPDQIKAREICPDVEGQYGFFRRTTILNVGQLTEKELVQRLNAQAQVLCILNSRRRVQRIYEALEGEGIYHLSTLMYPKHRKALLAKIRERLDAGKPCRLIATSLVEAGVDFDFPAVYRELAGIDSDIQADGRCNREGKDRKEDCRTVIFTLENAEGVYIPPELKLPIKVAGQIAEKYQDIASPEAVSEYFKRLFYLKGEALDAKDIVKQMEQGSRSLMFPFASIAKQFQLIENPTVTILIDKEPKASDIAERIRRGEYSRQLMRKAGQFCVNIYKRDFEALNGAGRLEQLIPELYVLRNKEQYTDKMGLAVNVSRGEAVVY